MEELRTILRELKNILGQEGFTDIEQKDILEQSVKIYLTKQINLQKGVSNYQNKEKSSQNDNADEITPKQKAFLEKAGKFKEGMTKQEAFQIIEEIVKGKKKKEDY